MSDITPKGEWMLALAGQRQYTRSAMPPAASPTGAGQAKVCPAKTYPAALGVPVRVALGFLTPACACDQPIT